MTFLRQRWKQKPREYGPFSRVQSSFFSNLERIGIDHETCVTALPCWGPGDQRDFSKNALVGANNGAVYDKGALGFDGSAYLSIPNVLSGLPDFTVLADVKTSVTSTATDLAILGQWDTKNQVFLWLDAVFDVWQFAVVGDLELKIEPGTIPANADRQIIIAEKTTSEISLTINKVSDGSDTGSIGNTVITSDPIYIGSVNGLTDREFEGWINSLLIFSTTLSNSQKSILYENINGLWQKVAPTTYFFQTAEAGGSTITATDITTGTPVVDTPSISQTHGFTAQDIDSLSPTVDTPNIGQEHTFSAQGITAETPIVSAPSLSEGSHSLISTSITTDVPTVDTPTVGQIHVLSVTDVVTGDPIVDPATIGQVHAFISSAILTGAPTFNAPVLTELTGPADNLTATDIETGTPDVDTPSIGQIHALAASKIDTGFPVLESPAISQTHALAVSGVLTNPPVLSAPSLQQGAHALTMTDILAGAPIVVGPGIGQTHALTSISIVVGTSIVGIPALNFSTLPTPQERTFIVPFENRTYTVV